MPGESRTGVMEAQGAAGSDSSSRQPQKGDEGSGLESDGSPGAGEEASTARERQEALDQRLRESLEEFDEMLLAEQETLAEHRRPADAGSAGGRSGGGEEGSGSPGGAGSSGESGSEGDSQDAGQSSGAAAGGNEDGKEGGAGATTNSGSAEGSGGAVGAGAKASGVDSESSRIPGDIPDGKDDDIVARQLREAAMSEDDPELRERLWQEYRDYKSGKRSSRRKPAQTEQGEGDSR